MEHLKPALGDVPRGPLWREDLLLLQEVPRRAPGWSRVKVEDRLVVSHRGKSQWRGVGIAFNETAWALQKRVAAGQGCWFQLKNLSSSVQIWCGTFHFPPGVPLVEFESALTLSLKRKPRTTLPVIVQGDVNAHFRWAQAARGDSAVSTDGRSLLFRDRVTASGLQISAPVRSQQLLPTSRPRQADRAGHHIDLFLTQRVLRGRVEIMVDSHRLLGTDHEALWEFPDQTGASA